MPPQTAVIHPLRERVTPAHESPLGATVVGVFGAEFLNIGPVKALNGG